jgi:hypothetical protein
MTTHTLGVRSSKHKLSFIPFHYEVIDDRHQVGQAEPVQTTHKDGHNNQTEADVESERVDSQG